MKPFKYKNKTYRIVDQLLTDVLQVKVGHRYEDVKRFKSLTVDEAKQFINKQKVDKMEMTAIDLIRFLEKCNPEAKISVVDHNANYSGHVVKGEDVQNNGEYVHIFVNIADQAGEL